jgi:deoxyribodipyrimidine photolyase-related protein
MAVVIFPHQLFKSIIPDATSYYIVEHPRFFTRFKFHIQKIAMHKLSIRYYRMYIESKGKKAYIVNELISIPIQKFKQIHIYDPTDFHLFGEIRQWAAHKLKIHPSPMFLLKPTEALEFLENARIARTSPPNEYSHANFYIAMRKHLSILVNKDMTPVDDKWSFDTSNRNPLPSTVRPPTVFKPIPDATLTLSSVKSMYPSHYGTSKHIYFPFTHEQAEEWLHTFIAERFQKFGKYEDAISKRSPTIFHSVLSASLNIGLLTPDMVVKSLLATKEIPIESMEAIIRQIIGWREYMRAIYLKHWRYVDKPPNYWKSKRNLSPGWWTGKTSVSIIDNNIEDVLEYGYAHHIIRLMVFGSAMMMCNIHPQQAFRWFSEMFVDAYDWVMVGNVYCMSQHASEEKYLRRPYFSSEQYLLRMSDYKNEPNSKSNWTDIWRGMYYGFMEHNIDKLDPYSVSFHERLISKYTAARKRLFARYYNRALTVLTDEKKNPTHSDDEL